MPPLSPDLLGLSLLLGIGLGVLITTVIGRTIYMLTHPLRRTYASIAGSSRPGDPSEIPPPRGPRPYTNWPLRSRGRDLPVWDIPAENPRGPVIIFTHGWGDSRIGSLSRAAELLTSASRLILWDLPGHGEAPGSSALGTHEVQDLLNLIAKVREPGVEIVLFGWSMGAAISIAAAARDVNHRKARIAGVIAEAPFRHPRTPARNILKSRNLPHTWNLIPAMWLLGLEFRIGPTWRGHGGFDTVTLAARLDCPLLVIHGALDEHCPIEDGREIAAAAKSGAIEELPTAGHHGIWTNPQHTTQARAATEKFLRSLRAP